MTGPCSICTDINKAQQKLFAKRNNIKQIPPTRRVALEQHVKRATYQGEHVWGQSLLTTPVLLAGDGQRQKMVCMNQIGQPFQKHPKSAMSWYHASAKRDV